MTKKRNRLKMATASFVFIFAAPNLDFKSEDIRSKLREVPNATKLTEIVDARTFVVETKPKSMVARPVVFVYLLDHLEECATAGKALGLSTYKARREPDQRLFGDDGHGVSGYLTIVRAGNGERIIFLQQEIDGVLTIGGEAVILLTYQLKVGALSPTGTEYRLRGWIRLNNPILAFFSRIFAARARLVAKRQLMRMLGVPVAVAQAIESNPDGILARLEESFPDETAPVGPLINLIRREYAKP